MARAYCSVSDVSRLLRTATNKVKLSDSYRNMGTDSNNTGTIQLTNVDFLSSYVGAERFDITFSSTTAYACVGEETGTLGTGNINSTYTNQYFSILSSYWTGSPQINDAVYFESNSNISDNDVSSFINDVTDLINNKLGLIYGGDTTAIPWEADATVSLPSGLKYACMRRTAYEIFTSVLYGEEDSDVVKRWYDQAENAIETYMKWISREYQNSAPRWLSRTNDNTLFRKLGLEGLGDAGEVDVTEDTEADGIYRR